MRQNRQPDVVTNAAAAAEAARDRGHRLGAGVVRLASVTGLAAAACALFAAPAGAATAAAHAAKAPSKISVYIRPKTALTGSSVSLSATVTSSGQTPTGTVRFGSGGTPLCRARLSKGSATCSTKFTKAGVYRVRATYSGDATHAGVWGTARVSIKSPLPPGVSATTTTITSPAYISSEPAGTPFTVTATVKSADGSVPTGTVSFAPNNLGPGPMPGYLECNATLVNGTGSCIVDPPVGTWGFVLYTARYSGDPTHAASKSSGEHKLITLDVTKTALTFNPSPATEGAQVTLTATVTDEPKDALASAFGGPDLVTFSVGGVAIPGCTNVAVSDPSNGPDNVATCTYTPTTTGPLSVTAAYLGNGPGGDVYAAPSADTETLTVT
jgi:Bacterial Ig-like domain (group 3)